VARDIKNGKLAAIGVCTDFFNDDVERYYDPTYKPTPSHMETRRIDEVMKKAVLEHAGIKERKLGLIYQGIFASAHIDYENRGVATSILKLLWVLAKSKGYEYFIADLLHPAS
jgi:hypothetical protein